MADPVLAPTPAPGEPFPIRKLLKEPDETCNGQTHVGVAIEVKADGRVSHIMMPDITRLGEGYPVFITAPVRLNFANLVKFLEKKGVHLGTAAKGLIKHAYARCDAFYYSSRPKELTTDEEVADYNKKHNLTTETKKEKGAKVDEGPLLMVFRVGVKEGLIKSLTNDDDLASLFDVESVTLRVLRCSEGKPKEALQRYVELLPED